MMYAGTRTRSMASSISPPIASSSDTPSILLLAGPGRKLSSVLSTPRLAQPLEPCALVREQGQHCVCPVSDVVELLLVTNPHESGGQDVELLLAELLRDFFV